MKGDWLRHFFVGLFAIGLFLGLIFGAAIAIWLSAEIHFLIAGNAFLLSSFGVLVGAALSFLVQLYFEDILRLLHNPNVAM
ncbi:hypothetical protein RC74_00555 [Falsihalocynthiibacter arcticus]|uniref:Uncharacterized protein n=1 Tax=Falsihalocynthiibacter arcticus TaxID=1579316 RepID=A0A126UV94_9RHOB|nr:hypothetical protein RC74_00555 [Falsihalocynthiibacter arcticus]